ncbi:MAG: glycosyltransferase family A protein [Lachnospiraceae bacterium]|nr:glycosyltransferase family A protein [Lachnospiraceae bacterium]
MNEIIMTFAIPTYNRPNKLEEILREILQYNEERIEIVLSDASTNRETYELVRRIDDSRIRYLVRNDMNSTIQLIENAIGKYFMFVLDKDKVIGKYIKTLIEFLKSNNDILYGRCQLSFEPKRRGQKFEIIPKGYEGVKEIGYRIWHPTGFFLHRQKCLNHIKREILEGYTYFWYGEVAMLGKGVFCNIPLIKTEALKDAARVKSHSAANGKASQMFFAPDYQKKLFRDFMSNLSNLPLKKKYKRYIMVDIFFRQINAVTFQYKEIMSNKMLCAHYAIKPKKISNKELFTYEIEFLQKEIPYMLNTLNLSVLEKIVILIMIAKKEIMRFYRLMILQFVKEKE